MAAEATAPVDLLAADVGNSKTELALVRRDGSVLAAVRGPTASHQRLGLTAAAAALAGLAERARNLAGIAAATPLAAIAVECAAGADLPSDVGALRRAYAAAGLATDHLVLNDCFAPLRAGTGRSWGVAVVCGSGINCMAVSPAGRTVRFDALGEISGDAGGGFRLGLAALGAGVRAEDGRGAKTVLAASVAAHFGRRRAHAVSHDVYRGRIAEERLGELAPLVFEAATRGDAPARAIADALADEVVAFAAAAIRRAGLARLDPDVVLSGGVFATNDAAFHERIRAGIAAVAPRATLRRLDAPPLVGAALLGLDALHEGRTPDDVEARLRAGLTPDRLTSA